jgi:hypothetical protein
MTGLESLILKTFSYGNVNRSFIELNIRLLLSKAFE